MSRDPACSLFPRREPRALLQRRCHDTRARDVSELGSMSPPAFFHRPPHGRRAHAEKHRRASKADRLPARIEQIRGAQAIAKRRVERAAPAAARLVTEKGGRAALPEADCPESHRCRRDVALFGDLFRRNTLDGQQDDLAATHYALRHRRRSGPAFESAAFCIDIIHSRGQELHTECQRVRLAHAAARRRRAQRAVNGNREPRKLQTLHGRTRCPRACAHQGRCFPGMSIS